MPAFAVEDLYKQRTVESIHANPRSSRVLFALKRPDPKTDSDRTALWLSDETGVRKIVAASWKPVSQELSRDGSCIAYVSKRIKGKAELRLLELTAAVSERVGDASTTLESIADWSPVGNRLLLLHKVACAEDELDDVDATHRPYVARHAPYKRDGNGFVVGFRDECRVLDLTTGHESALLKGDFDVQQAVWSPDGCKVACIRTRSGAQRHRTDVWILDANGDNARQLTYGLVSVNNAAWSPDGLSLALSASAVEGDSIAELWIVDVQSGCSKRATCSELHLEPGALVWHPDGRYVAVNVSSRGLHQLMIVDTVGGNAVPLERGLSQVTAAKATRDGLVFVAATVRECGELYRVGWDGDGETRLTRFNLGWFSRRLRPCVRKQEFSVPAGDGEDESIDAWILTPDDRDPPYPVLMDMHGGPQSTALIDFASHVYWYELVARGWMIVAPNAVGSSGYGFHFARRLRGRWGTLDLPQHESILEQLRASGIAADVAVCAGKSYGGFLSAWALGHSDCFNRVVICAPVANLESHAGTSDSGYYVSPFAVGAELHESRRLYRALSPVEACASRRVPALLLQGDSDQRCPVGQSEEIFTHLIRCSSPATLVVYPGGSHALSTSGKPSHRVNYHRRIIQWAQQAIDEQGGASESVGSAVQDTEPGEYAEHDADRHEKQTPDECFQ
jgi:dipeptidyl aminopeptidase/acylaminoacyl peptidase